MANAPLPQPRLGDYFELKAKRIYLAPNWIDRTGKARNEPYRTNLLEFRRRIELGLELPPRFYRNHIGRTPDELLIHTGAKHVHLGTTKDDVLLFVQEFDDFIVLLEIADHKANFHQIPVGYMLVKNQITPLRARLPGILAQEQQIATGKIIQARKTAALSAARASAKGKMTKKPGP